MTETNVVTLMPVTSRFRTHFDSKRVNGSQTLLEPALHHFYRNFPLIQDKLCKKTSLLVRSKTLGLLGKTLSTDRMYSRHSSKKFPQQAQTLVSLKRGTYSAIFIAFLTYTYNFAPFENEGQLHSFNILEVIDRDKCGYFNARNLLFQNTLRQ